VSRESEHRALIVNTGREVTLMGKISRLAAPIAVAGIAGLAGLALALPANAATSTTYQATLSPVPLNTPSGAASGHLTLTLNGDQATVSE